MNAKTTKSRSAARKRKPRAAMSKPSLRPLEPPANQRTVMCHYCGYEPPMAKIPEEGRCPKCRGSSWEQFVIPRRIFAQNG